MTKYFWRNLNHQQPGFLRPLTLDIDSFWILLQNGPSYYIVLQPYMNAVNQIFFSSFSRVFVFLPKLQKSKHLEDVQLCNEKRLIVVSKMQSPFKQIFPTKSFKKNFFDYRKSSKETRGSYSISQTANAGRIRLFIGKINKYAGLIGIRFLFEGGSLSRIYSR